MPRPMPRQALRGAGDFDFGARRGLPILSGIGDLSAFPGAASLRVAFRVLATRRKRRFSPWKADNHSRKHGRAMREKPQGDSAPAGAGGPRRAGARLARTLRATAAAALLWGLCLTGGAAIAAAGPGDAPVYNPATKSYFQMLPTTSRHGNWPESLVEAQGQFYKGVRGRLAVINTPEVHEFVMRNFDVSREMWIGLRYWCEFRLLEWVGLRPFSPSDPGHFRAWHPQWWRGQQLCPPNARGPDAFVGVYYQPTSKSSALWQAVGQGKGFGRVLVEYPTGGE